MVRPSFFFSVFVFVFLVFAAPLMADEGEHEDSEAARLFRDAWWAETGRGALQKAVDGYRKAAVAEGGKQVRARALYRMAVVLQRMGKAAEAVGALERLAKDFPGETALLAQAQQRLDEWSAEDLRTSFSDWYKRYQYSAAFQAKIVDLVLKLGGADQGASNAARKELLTIGEPALNALREHTDSANYQLRYIAIELILEIGSLPPPEVLWKGGWWQRKREFWNLLAAAKESERAAYAQAAAAKKDDYRSSWITAFLAGPDAVLDVVAKEKKDTQSVTSALLGHMLRKDPKPEFYERLRSIVRAADVNDDVRRYIANRLLSTWRHARSQGKPDPTGLTPAELVSWVDHKVLHNTVLPAMRTGSIPSPDAWKAAARASLALPPGTREQPPLLAAMLGQLRIVPPDTDVSLAVKALSQYLAVQSIKSVDFQPVNEGNGYQGSGALGRAVLAKTVATTGGVYIRSAPRQYWNWLRQIEGTFDVVLSWVANAADADVRKSAMQIVAGEIRDDVGRLTQLLGTREAQHELRSDLFASLNGNPALEILDWDAEGLTRLVETARTYDRYSKGRTTSFAVRTQGGANAQIHSHFQSTDARVIARLLQVERTRKLCFEAAFASPQRFPPTFWGMLGEDWPKQDENRDMVLRLLRAHWKTWTTEQRPIGFRLFVSSPLMRLGGDEVTGFLREVLAERDLDSSTRFFLMGHLPTLTLDDLKAVYDFSDPTQRQQAAALLGRVSKLTLAGLRTVYDFGKPEDVDAATGLLGRLERTEAVYDAFRPALRPNGPTAVAIFNRFKSQPASRVMDLIRGMLAHGNGWIQERGLELLLKRDKAADLPIWIDLLEHTNPDLRMGAAKALGRLYNAAAIKALAKAVDDEDPGVRDAVLAALERIEKTEKQKERWRKYAKGK